MRPPHSVPPGILQLVEVVGEQRLLVAKLPMSSKNRDRINRMRNDILMTDPTRTLLITENNAIHTPHSARD